MRKSGARTSEGECCEARRWHDWDDKDTSSQIGLEDGSTGREMSVMEGLRAMITWIITGFRWDIARY